MLAIIKDQNKRKSEALTQIKEKEQYLLQFGLTKKYFFKMLINASIIRHQIDIEVKEL